MNILKLALFFMVIALPLSALNLPTKEFIKRGFQHCTGTCDNEKICNDPKLYQWCLENCSHKINPDLVCKSDSEKKKAEEILRQYKKTIKEDETQVEKLKYEAEQRKK